MRALATKRTKQKQDLYFAAKLAFQKLPKYYAKVTPTTGMQLSSAQILDPFWMLQLFRKLDMEMAINPENETS
jgi:hypothetical protein